MSSETFPFMVNLNIWSESTTISSWLSIRKMERDLAGFFMLAEGIKQGRMLKKHGVLKGGTTIKLVSTRKRVHMTGFGCDGKQQGRRTAEIDKLGQLSRQLCEVYMKKTTRRRCCVIAWEAHQMLSILREKAAATQLVHSPSTATIVRPAT